MNTRETRSLKFLIITLFFYGLTATAGQIRISFLEDAQVRNDACELLKTNGVSQKVVQEFERLVKEQNASGNGVDTKRFPTIKNGWYEFRNLSDLTNRSNPHVSSMANLLTRTRKRAR